MDLFDTHAHLDQEEFSQDLADVLDRARQAGVNRIVAVGTTADSSEATCRLAQTHAGVYAAVGIQPNYCAEAAEQEWSRVEALVDQPRVVAIGESGLDRHWDFTPFPLQQDYFDRHLRLSQTRRLPIIIHTRESDAEVLEMLHTASRRGPVRGIMHSFTGTSETAAECVALGLHISFAGMVTFKKSDALREVAATIPDERLLIETDSPYLSPHPLRGKRNEPARVEHTARCLAEVRGITVKELAAQTAKNARQLFAVD